MIDTPQTISKPINDKLRSIIILNSRFKQQDQYIKLASPIFAYYAY